GAGAGTWGGAGVGVGAAGGGGGEGGRPPASAMLRVAFSPDGRWLAANDGAGCRLWRAGSWEAGPAVGLTRTYGGAQFSSDSRLLAGERGGGVLWLVGPPTGRRLAVLQRPRPGRCQY